MISGAKFSMDGSDTFRTGPPALGWTLLGWLAGPAWVQEGMGRQWPESSCILCHLVICWASGQLCPEEASTDGGRHFQATEAGPGSNRRTDTIVLRILSAHSVFGDLIVAEWPREPGTMCINVSARGVQNLLFLQREPGTRIANFGQ